MAKKIILVVFILASYLQVIGQISNAFNYQAVIRDSDGSLIKNYAVNVQISIIESTIDGTPIYTETHSDTTSSVGLINLAVGKGTPILGSFESINWGENPKFIKIEVNTGNGLVDMGTFQLYSVPYANYAKDVENKDDADADPTNEIQDLDLTGNVLTITNNPTATPIDLSSYVGINTDEQTLSLSGTNLSIANGNDVDLGILQDGVDDADADSTNEIQDLNLAGDILTITNNSSPTQINLAKYLTNTDEQELSLNGTDLTISGGNTIDVSSLQGPDSSITNEIQSLDLNGDTLAISDGNKVVFPYDSSRWAISGDKMYYNTGNVGIGSSNPVSNLEVKATSSGSGALFQVINSNNDTVFAVYPDGVKIFVDSQAKGKVGGFAVSGRNPSKAGEVDILKVTLDSTRIYVNDTASSKGKVGGFAVSGRNPSKGGNNDILFVTGDSTRVYVNESTGTKGKVGGFAVSGRNPSKGAANDYLQVTKDSTRIFTRDTMSGFGVRDLTGGSSVSYLQLSPLNYFIGHESGELVQQDPENPGMGKYNTFFGYKAGQNTVSGFKNIFMGYKSGQANISGGWNIFIGNEAGANSQDGLSNIFIGDQAGYNFSNGVQNVFIGNEAGYSTNVNVYNNLFVGNSAGKENVSGNYNTYLGISAGYNALGDDNTYVGNSSGFSNTGSENTLVGSQSGIYTVAGEKNVYIGYKAGFRSFGSRNVFIGTNANNTNFSSVDYSNCIGIGDSVIVSGDNEIRIGNLNSASFYASGIYSSTTANTPNLYISSSGRIYRSTSSRRYKKDIVPLEINTSKIYDLKPVSYTSKTDNKRYFGLIAEDVANVIPELAEFAIERDVIPGSNSEKLIPDAVKYSSLPVLLLKEIQKHEETIKKQDELIKSLEEKNKNLELRLKVLEKKVLE